MIDHLSYSSISTYLTCPEHWRRKYVQKEKTPATPALIFGSAIHGTLEQAITERHNGQALIGYMPLNALWQNIWAEKVRSEEVEWGADTPEQHFNEGIRILGAPDVQRLVDGTRLTTDEGGLFMERKVTLNVPGVPVPVTGFVDILHDDGVPGDFKTSSMAWTMDKAREQLQPLFYLAALNQAGHTVPGLRFRHHVITKTKAVKVQTLECQRTWDEVFWLFDLIRRVWEGIEREVYPYHPDAWICSPRYCAYWHTCRGKGLT